MNQVLRLAATACVLVAATGPCSVFAQTEPAPAAAETSSGTEATASSGGRFALHGQATFTGQATPGFASPYLGANSLTPHQAKETFDITASIGSRLWRGAELWVDPEIDQGFGLSDTLGVAGFPSGEAYKVGKSDPYFKLPRAFLRQTINLGGERSSLGAAANQIAGTQTANRLVITLGKFSVVDVFDTNSYAHDPRGDFLNWTLIDTGAFDYAANAWGFTFGGAAEWYQGPWTMRVGLFNLSKQPNQPSLEINLSQNQLISEVEHRHVIGGHAGAVRLGAWRSHGRFVKLADAISAFDATGIMPDPADLRHPRNRSGGYIDAEQEVSANLGMFLRAGLTDGTIEADDFTDVDRTLALGMQLKGTGWGRRSDSVGLAGVVNGISKTRQLFLNDGGLGILVGDGQLPHPGSEEIIEAYYNWQVMKGVNVTADYQFIANPGYNRDRGPTHVFGLRLHGAF